MLEKFTSICLNQPKTIPDFNQRNMVLSIQSKNDGQAKNLLSLISF